MHCSHVSKSTSTVTTTATIPSTAATVSVSGVSQQQDELRLLSDVSVSQTSPYEALATDLAITFDDDDQRQSASSLSLSDEPSRSQKSSQPVEDVAPIVREEPSPDLTDKWIMMSGDEKKPFKCGHKGCGRKHSKKEYLQAHLVTHTGDSKLRCYAGDCTGTVVYSKTKVLVRHIQEKHTFKRPFECKICNRRFKRSDHLKHHMGCAHFIKSKKNSPKPHSISESCSASTTTFTASISTITSRFSQPELAARRRQQGSFVDLSKTVHTPESTQTLTDYQQQAGLRLLAEVSAAQIEADPFEALATHQTVTFDNEHPGRSASSLSLSNEPSRSYKLSQPVNDTTPIVREEESSDPTEKWIIVDKSQKKPYKCGYPGCVTSYLQKANLIAHFTRHTGKSKFKCPHPGCVGKEYFRDNGTLKRHIFTQHTSERPFQCDRCKRRYGRRDHLRNHRLKVHGIKEEEKLRVRKRK